jgi:hypothetical protein
MLHLMLTRAQLRSLMRSQLRAQLRALLRLLTFLTRTRTLHYPPLPGKTAMSTTAKKRRT